MVGEGSNLEAKDFRTFSPKVLAGIRDLPGTVGDRSIPIVLKRKAPGETVERFRIRRVRAETTPIRERLEGWAQSAGVDALVDSEPVMPPGLHDREEDLWEPLIAVADLAGGDWPARGRAAAVRISEGAKDDADDGSVGIQLLVDIQTVFSETDERELSTKDLIRALGEMKESPWATWSRGEAISEMKVGKFLKPYGVKSKRIRVGDVQLRGYERERFTDAWARYCPPSGAEAVTSRHTPHGYAGNTGFPSRHNEASVTPSEPPANPYGYADVTACDGSNGQGGAQTGRDALIDAQTQAQLDAISLSQVVINRLTLLEQWDVLNSLDGYPTTETGWHDYCAEAITHAAPARLREAMRLIGQHRTVWKAEQ